MLKRLGKMFSNRKQRFSGIRNMMRTETITTTSITKQSNSLMTGLSKVGTFSKGLLLALGLSFTHQSMAAEPSDFEIEFREARGSVAVIEFTGNYDRDDEGEFNSLPRQLIAQEFYANHADNYDFLVVFTTFDFEKGEADAFHTLVKNDIQGIGHAQFDNSDLYGSTNGRLKGFTDMASIDDLASNPLAPEFDSTLALLGHELLHQWSANVSVNTGGGTSRDLIGKDNIHWSNLFDSGASLLYGHQWNDNNDGTFSSTSYQKFISPLDLYLAGFNQAEEVPPMTLIENASLDNTLTPAESNLAYGNTISGSQRTITIDHIIAAEGPRIPSFENSQKDFNVGFILLVPANESVEEAKITSLKEISRGFIDRFSIWTGGRATLSVSAEARPTEAGSPGEVIAGDVRTDPADIAQGFAWLRDQQDAEGFWQDKAQSTIRDTATVLDVLRRLDPEFTRKNSALDWIESQAITNIDFQARQSKVAFDLGRENYAVQQANQIVEKQNTDGGWGVNSGFSSNPFDTALALSAVANTGRQSSIDNAVSYLHSSQNEDGGWSSRESAGSKTYVTTLVLDVLNKLNQHETVSSVAIDWLATKQNTDGGFGESASTIHATASVIKTFINYNAGERINFGESADYLLQNQQTNGSWGNSLYATALTLDALQQFSYPNLMVNPEVTVASESIRDGDRVRFDLTISNNSNIETAPSRLRLYEGDPNAGGIAAGSDIEIPLLGSGMSVDLSVYWDSMDKIGEQQIYLVADPDDSLVEMSELDNVQFIDLTVEAATVGIDVSVSPLDVLVTPANPNTLPQDIGFAVSLRNQGTEDANNLLVQLRKDSADGLVLDQQTLNILGRGSLATNFTHSLQDPGTTRYFVVLDPLNNINETNEENNTAEKQVRTLNSVDLQVTTQSISIPTNDILLGGDVDFNVNLRNLGTIDSASFDVRYQISNGVTTQDIQTSQSQISAGGSVSQTITWRVDLTGELTFSVFIDEFNLIPEVNELNNNAQLSLSAGTASGPNLTLSFQDIIYTPEVALESASANLSVLVRNNGSVSAANVEVGFYNGDPANGGELIGLAPSISLDSDSSERVSIDWAVVPEAGDIVVHAIADPNQAVAEFLESDNSAFKVLKSLSLADLTVSASDINLTPALPKEGDAIQLNVRVYNFGEQNAQSVLVNVYNADPEEGGQQIASGTFAEIAADSHDNIVIDLGSNFAPGNNQLFIAVNPENTVLEKVTDNNTATKDFVIQNGDLYLSERFISPNGDLVQDSTEVFYRLASPQNVSITVVNSRLQEVREFKGGLLDNSETGSVIWDGLDQLGRVVSDGIYKVYLKSGLIELGSLEVEVDNNRSSLLAAMGTNNNVITNLTCQVSDYDNFLFSNDESKIVFSIDGVNSGDLYSPGIYQMSANGTDIKQVVPQSFFDSNEMDIPRDNSLFLSPDGKTVVFSHRNFISFSQTVITYWKVDLETNVTSIILQEDRSGYSDPKIQGLTSDSQNLIELDTGVLSTISMDVGLRVEKVNIFDSISQGSELSDTQISLSYDNESLVIEGDNYNDFQHYMALVDIDSGSITTLDVSVIEGEGEGEQASFLTVAWMKNNQGLALFNKNDETVELFNRQGVSLSKYQLPSLNTNVDKRTITGAAWSPLNDEVAFSYFAGEVKPSSNNETHYPNESDLGGIYKLSTASGSFTPIFEYRFSNSNCNADSGTCDPQFEGPAPSATSLLWNEYETLVYSSERYPYLEENNSEFVNETWTLDVSGELPPLQILANFSEGRTGFDSQNALKERRFSPLGTRFLFRSDFGADSNTACKFDQKDEWSYRSLLNLTADLRTKRASTGGGIVLSGTATDKNFSSYSLEYASGDDSNNWSSIQPAVNKAVIDGELGFWVPPSTGVFFVRLTVSDSAGNKKYNLKRVIWSEETAIGNLYRDESYISPNGDGVKDFSVINYLVLQPVHLEFDFFDSNSNLVRTIVRDHAALGEEYSVSWDGRNNDGNILDDGTYTMRVLGYEFEFITDNTAPVVQINSYNAYHPNIPNEPEDPIYMGTPYLDYQLTDINPESGILNRVSVDSQSRTIYREINDVNFNQAPIQVFEASNQYFTGASFELIATDLAGNRTTVNSDQTQPELILAKYGPHATTTQNGRPVFKEIESVTYTVLGSNDLGELISIDSNKSVRIEIPETINEPLQQLSVEYREIQSSSWESELITKFTHSDSQIPAEFTSLSNVDHNFFAYWDHERLDIGREYVVRLRAIDMSGSEYFSNVLTTRVTDSAGVYIQSWRRDMDNANQPVNEVDSLIRSYPGVINSDAYIAWGKNDVNKAIDSVELFVLSEGDPRYLTERFIGSVEQPGSNFIFPINDLTGCYSYSLRTVAVAEDGEVFSALTQLNTPCLELYVKTIPNYAESCNATTNQISTIDFSTVSANNVDLKLLTLTPEGEPNNVLFNINNPNSSPIVDGEPVFSHHFDLDTTLMAEGEYQYVARLVNSEDEEVVRSLTLLVDKTPPELAINTPLEGAKVCKTSLVIDGSVSDSNSFRYFLSYSQGTTFEQGSSEVFWFKGADVPQDLLKLNTTNKLSIDNEISPSVSINGELGNFEFVPNIAGDVTVQLTALDQAGFRQCSVRSLQIDGEVGFVPLTTEPYIFSPNSDGVNDSLLVEYESFESVNLTLQVYTYSQATSSDTSGIEVNLDELQATVLEDQTLALGSSSASWNGTDDNGVNLPDGDYVLVFSVEDNCGNTTQYFEYAFIDTQAPSVNVSYPNQSDPLGMIIEIQGSITEQESIEFKNQLKDSILDYGVGSIPLNWVVLNQGDEVSKNVLHNPVIWNTHGLAGLHTLRVTAEDLAGNSTSVFVPVNIDNQVNLINYLESVENLFSPNADSKRDSSSIRFGLEEDTLIDLSIEDLQGNTLSTLESSQAYSAGAHIFNWAGLNDGNSQIADGVYRVNLIASLASNTAIRQQESVLITIDQTSPIIELTRPANGFANSESGIVGSVEDGNLKLYEVMISNNTLTPIWQVIAAGDTNVVTSQLASLSDYAEGDYALRVVAEDFAETVTDYQVLFTIDNTSPKVTITEPANNSFVGAVNGDLNILGSFDETNPDSYSIEYFPLQNPASATSIVTSNVFSANEVSTALDIAPIPDGEYSIQISIQDKGGLETNANSTIIVDNSPPTALISSPSAQAYVTEAQQIVGIANDTNIAEYRLSVASIDDSSDNYSTIYNRQQAVENGNLTFWQNLPSDGNYNLKLEVTDKADNKTEAIVPIIVDTTAPLKPIGLDSELENGQNIRLSWLPNTELDLAGYLVLRAGVIISPLTSSPSYLVQNAEDGVFEYSVVAVDNAGLNSEPSDPVIQALDSTPPTVGISSPVSGDQVSSLASVMGTAYSSDDFKEYRVYISYNSGPQQLIRRSPIPVQSDLLVDWNTIGLSESDSWTLTLQAEDLSGNVDSISVDVAIDNTPPEQPTGLNVELSGNSATLSWDGNSDNDLLGYLVYRNDSIANSNGPIIGSLEPFALVTTSYADAELPDGTHAYSVVAIDEAGNLSLPSIVEEVQVDVRAPSALISRPIDNSTFEDPLVMKAESEDLDIAQIEFQYRLGANDWVEIATIIDDKIYQTSLDPESLGWSYGTYQLRGIATDQGGQVDANPVAIEVSYSDLTPPEPVQGFSASVQAETINLNWIANAEADLDSYTVFYKSSDQENFEVFEQVAGSQTSLSNSFLPENTYTFYLVATDINGNASVASNEVTGMIYTPNITHPYTPTKEISTSIVGISPLIATVSGEVNNSQGITSINAFDTELDGNFSLDNINLIEGETLITLRLTDLEGNTSKDYVATINQGQDPSIPTGLVADVDELNVTLDWNDNPENNILGYRIFDNDLPISEQVLQTVSSFAASSDSPSFSSGASSIGDGLSYTFWSPDFNYDDSSSLAGEWVQLDFSANQLVSHVEIDWLNTVGSASDYDLQAWTGSGWLSIHKVRNNTESNNAITLSGAYNTEKLRVLLLSPSPEFRSSLPISIREVRVYSLNMVSESTFATLSSDGIHRYSVTAVNELGFESSATDAVDASVGDVTPPEAIVVSAEVILSDVNLSWTSSGSNDLSYYEVYRNDESIAVLSDISVTTFSDINVTNGNHNYYINSVDQVGNLSQSNELTLVVNAEVLDAPYELSIQTVESGNQLSLSWNHTDVSNVVEFQILRSTEQGAGYVQMASTSELVFEDLAVQNGQAYFYVVVAVDSINNLSEFSNEASAIPADLVSPNTPLIHSPATIYSDFISRDSIVSVTGLAEAGTRVDLLRNGNEISEAYAAQESTYDWHEPEFEYDNIQYNVDGKGFIYEGDSNNTNLSYYSLETTSENVLVTTSNSSSIIARFNQDGTKVVFIDRDLLTYRKFVRQFDLTTSSVSTLITATQANVNAAILSNDGRYIAMLGRVYGDEIAGYGLWIYDLENEEWGDNFHSGSQVELDSLNWSPDGEHISFIDGDGLVIYSLENQEIVYANELVSGQRPQWSIDSQSLLYEFQSEANSEYQIARFDISNQVESILLSSATNLSDAVWSPDASHIYYVNDLNNLERRGVTNNETVTIIESERRINLAQISATGNLLADVMVNSTSGLAEVSPKGQFEIANVRLSHGLNSLQVESVDSSNNNSELSNLVNIDYQLSNQIDLSISSESILFLPQVASSGETVRLSIVIENLGNNFANQSGISVTALTSNGELLSLLDNAPVPFIQEQSSTTINYDWELSEIEGPILVTVVLDPQNQFLETNESNNVATSTLMVAGTSGLSTKLETDKQDYSISELVSVDATIANGSSLFSGNAVLLIEDAQGYLVSELSSATVSSLEFADSFNIKSSWSTEGIYSGEYLVVLNVFNEEGDLVISDRTQITLQQNSNFAVGLSTDKARYAGNSEIQVTAEVDYTNGNSIVNDLIVEIDILNSNSDVLESSSFILNELAPQSRDTVVFNWNTGSNPVAEYSASMRLRQVETVLATSSSSFEIVSSGLQLEGAIDLSGQTDFNISENFSASYEITNNGNVDLLQLEYRLLLISSDRITELQSFPYSLDIQQGQTASGQVTFDSSLLELGNYEIVIEYDELNNDNETQTYRLAFQSIQVVDLTPPVIEEMTPNNNDYINALSADTGVSVNDEHSDVSRVEVSLNEGAWEVLVQDEQLVGKYSLELEELSEEEHTLLIRAFDGFSNVTTSELISFVVDNTSPNITLSQVVHGGVYTSPVSPVFGVTDDNLSTVESTLNEVDFISGSVITQDGRYSLRLVGTDLAGNKTTSFNSFTIDTVAPVIQIDGVTDGDFTNQNIIPIISITDDNLISQSITLNGEIFVSGVSVTAEGTYSLIVTAQDIAGFQVDQAIDFTIDKTAAIVSVDGVMEGDVTVGNVTPTVSFSEADLAEQTITLNGQPFVNGTIVEEEGNYSLDVSAVDSAGNQTNFSLSFSIDRTPPVINVDGLVNDDVTSLDVSPIISVTDDNLISSTITLDGVEFVSGELISEEGSYQLVITATDAANNQTSQTLDFTIDRTSPDISVLGVVNEQHYLSDVSIDVVITDVQVATQSILLNNEQFVSGSLVTDEGEYLLDVTAEDSASNSSSTSLTFVIDKTTPVIAVGGVTNGQVYASAVTPTIQVSDTYLSQSSINLDDMPFTSGTEITEVGSYNLEIEASDQAGNISQTTISFEIVEANISLEVTSPLDGSSVNSETVNVTGTTAAGATVTLVLPDLTELYTSSDASGAFLISQVALVEGANLLRLSATSTSGASSEEVNLTITRTTSNTIYPVVTIVSGRGPYPAGTENIRLEFATDRASHCKVSANGVGDFEGWSNNVVSSDGLYHSMNVRLTQDNYREFYILCRSLENGELTPESTTFPVYFGDENILSKPIDFAADEPLNLTGDIVLTWQPISGATSYHVMEQKDGGYWNAVAPEPGSHSLTLYRPNNGRYLYHLSACLDLTQGVCSEFSEEVIVSVGADPSHFPPVVELVSGSGPYPDGTRELDIAITTNFESMCRYSGKDKGHLKYWAHDFSTQDGINHKNIVKLYGDNYSEVYVRCKALETGYYNKRSFVFPIYFGQDDVLTIPQNLLVDEPSNLNGEFTLTWDSVENAVSYHLVEKVGENNWRVIPTNDLQTSVTLMRPNLGAYRYQVSACTSDKTECSKFSNVEYVSVGGNPEELPPIISYVSGSGPYPLGATQGVMSVSTNIDANCRFNNQDDYAFEYWHYYLTPDNGRTHEGVVEMSGNHDYTVYVLCQSNSTGFITKDSFEFTFLVTEPHELAKPETPTVDNALNDGNFTISWQPVLNAESYKGELINNLDNYEFTAFDKNTLSVVFANRPPGDYIFRIAACADAQTQHCGAHSESVTVTVGD